jgi:hypothetical protein
MRFVRDGFKKLQHISNSLPLKTIVILASRKNDRPTDVAVGRSMQSVKDQTPLLN